MNDANIESPKILAFLLIELYRQRPRIVGDCLIRELNSSTRKLSEPVTSGREVKFTEV